MNYHEKRILFLEIFLRKIKLVQQKKCYISPSVFVMLPKIFLCVICVPVIMNRRYNIAVYRSILTCCCGIWLVFAIFVNKHFQLFVANLCG